jgi:hypothetical protein
MGKTLVGLSLRMLSESPLVSNYHTYQLEHSILQHYLGSNYIKMKYVSWLTHNIPSYYVYIDLT